MPDHRLQRARSDLLSQIMISHVNEADDAVNDSAIPPVARGPMSMEHKAALLDDRDELAKGASQTWQLTGSQTVESPPGVLP